MLSLDDWLQRVGFSGGNPFALKWADDERDRLQEYFVEHAAYHAVLDAGVPRSGVLYAQRGGGKSSTRLMFEAACAAAAAPPLVVRMIDWMPVVEGAAGGAVSARGLLAELLRLYVAALAEAAPRPADAAGLSPDEAGALRWICRTHAGYLLPGGRAALARAGWLGDDGDEAHSLAAQPVLRVLELLGRATRGLGFPACYVVIDGVDELYETAASWEAGADLLGPLLSNVRLLEVPHLAFKCFLPTEIVQVLRDRGQLRGDRVACTELTWGRDLLARLLRGRLMAYSDGQIESLAMLAEPDAGDVDAAICRAAASPRHLLSLGEQIVQAAARDATADRFFLRGAHLDRALEGTPRAGPEPAAAGPEPAPQGGAVPPLRLAPDGALWRGAELIEAARRLTPLQRRLLEYLYANSGTICSTDQLIEVAWSDRERPNDRDSLRRLVERLVEIVEPDPQQPVYLERIYGGYYVLRNTAR